MPENKEVRKLELCDIAPYFQYDLIVHSNYNNRRERVIGLSSEQIKCVHSESSNPVVWNWKYEEIKPYLRSLDQLTQEITHNGRTFIPIIELAKIAESDHFHSGNIDVEFSLNHSDMTAACAWNDENGVRYAFCYSSEHNGFYLKSEPYKELVIGNQKLLWAKLAEWHMDFNDLLSSGLAIPTLNTK